MLPGAAAAVRSREGHGWPARWAGAGSAFATTAVAVPLLAWTVGPDGATTYGRSSTTTGESATATTGSATATPRGQTATTGGATATPGGAVTAGESATATADRATATAQSAPAAAEGAAATSSGVTVHTFTAIVHPQGRPSAGRRETRLLAAVDTATLLSSMDREEYNRRRRALEEIYRADLELVRAAHEARVRSLETLWTAVSAEPAPGPVDPPPEPAVPQAVRPPRRPSLRDALEAVFPQLPEVFEKKDVIAAIGWTPSRAALFNVLQDMAIGGFIKVTPTTGRHPSRYRKL